MSIAFDDFELDDSVILGRVRAGQDGAYGLLYERHVGAARRLARSLVSSPAEADDIVAEVFAATLGAIRRGRGPATEFVPYVLRSVRHECRRSWRRTSPTRQTSLDESGEDLPSRDPDDFARADEQQVLHEAFVALPPRMRSVLWQVEVDGLSHDEIARRTHSTPQAIAQLVVRARRGLSERYLQAHLGGAPACDLPAACVDTRRSLAEYVRGTISAGRRRSVAEHLDTCAGCRGACDDLQLVNERLRGVVLLTLATTAVAPKPWVVGVVARATSWLLGPTASLTVASGLAVMTVIAPPPVFEATPEATPETVVAEAAPVDQPSADAVAEADPVAATSTAPTPDRPADPSSVVAAATYEPVAVPPAVVTAPPTAVPAAAEPPAPVPVDLATPVVTAVPPATGWAPGSPITVPPVVAAPVDAVVAAVPAVLETVSSIAPAIVDPLVPAVDADATVDVPPLPVPLLPPVDLPPAGAEVSIGDAGATVDVDLPLVDVPPVVLPRLGG